MEVSRSSWNTGWRPDWGGDSSVHAYRKPHITGQGPFQSCPSAHGLRGLARALGTLRDTSDAQRLFHLLGINIIQKAQSCTQAKFPCHPLLWQLLGHCVIQSVCPQLCCEARGQALCQSCPHSKILHLTLTLGGGGRRPRPWTRYTLSESRR